MPTVDLPRGIVVPRRIGEPLALGIGAAKAEFGYGVMNPANTIREVVEVLGALPWDEREQDMVNLALQFDGRINSGQFLEASVWPMARRRPPTASAGVVHLSYSQIVTAPTPLFAASDLEFIDGAGVRYTGTDDLDPPTLIHDTSGQTGTASETIGSGTTRIAQKVSIDDGDFPQAIRFGNVNSLTGAPVATAYLETDSAGDPSGTLANERLSLTLIALADGTVDVIFPKGAKVASADYWIVMEVSGGTVQFDGGVGGTADQVKVWNGSAWAASATVENLNVRLYNGGEFPVRAAQVGELGNISPGSITAVRPNSGAAQTLFDTLVGDNFENLENFTGGLDEEDDEQLRNRVRTASALRGTGSPGGIVFALTDGTVPGVTFADILENDTMAWGQDEQIFDNSGKTGSAGDLIDGVTYFRTAQRVHVLADGSVSAFAFKLNADTASTLTLRLETDTVGDGTGDPSGVLAAPAFEKTGIVPAGTSRVAVALAAGDFLDAGWYWLVAVRTAGSFRFDGSNSGGTNNVKRYTGAVWQASTALQDMNVEIFGGVPPKSSELFLEGGRDDDIAQAIYDLKPPGTFFYGPEEGTAFDIANREVPIRFARITSIDTVFDIEAEVTSEFTGSEDDLRDLIAEYVAELGIGDDLVAGEAEARLRHGDARTTGVFDVTLFRLGKKADYPTPPDLGSGQVVNLSLGFGQRFRVANPNADIRVTLTVV